MTHLGRLSSASQAGHSHSMPLVLEFHFLFKKPDFPAAELVVFFLRYHHISQLGGNHPAPFPCIPTKVRQVTMMSK